MHNRFQSWGEFLEFATESKPVSDLRKSRDTGDSRREFTGTYSFEETLNLAINGWPDGEARAKRLSDAIFSKVASLVEREEMVHDVVGGSIDIGAYLNNYPECWTRQESHIVDGNAPKIFRIVYNNSASAGVSADVLSAKGAAIAALVRALEFAGHRAEVWSIAICVKDFGDFGRDSGPPLHETRVQVKAADQDLDFGRLVFALAHPSMLRRLGFACLEADSVIHTVGSSYGLPCDCLQADRGDIYIAKSFYGEPQWQNEESVTKWILETLQQQGVSVKAAE